LVLQHLVVDAGGAREIAAGKAHLPHRVDDRPCVEAADIDMLDGCRKQLRLAGVVGNDVHVSLSSHKNRRRCGDVETREVAAHSSAPPPNSCNRLANRRYSFTTFDATSSVPRV